MKTKPNGQSWSDMQGNLFILLLRYLPKWGKKKQNKTLLQLIFKIPRDKHITLKIYLLCIFLDSQGFCTQDATILEMTITVLLWAGRHRV